MLFSDYYGVERTRKDTWFDPILDHDTRLFIDPFLVFKFGKGPFRSAHADLIRFFDNLFQVAADSGGKPHHPSYKKLHNMLLFPEVQELCLGYSRAGVAGAGTAKGFARVIAAAVFQSIALGIRKVEHLEEIGIFNEGIGPDRISDITANVLKAHLVAHTQQVCRQHGVACDIFRMLHVGFDYKHAIWNDAEVRLPTNPFSGRAVLLVPATFLRHLPTISVEDFWDYAWENKGEELRDDLNYEVKSKINKKGIIELAKERLFWVRDYVKYVARRIVPVPYDLDSDPEGLYGWAKPTSQFAAKHPLPLAAASSEGFYQVTSAIVSQFKLFVEENAGYKLLWDEGETRGKPEEASQLLFLGIAKPHCRANNIEVTREADIGRGPVDFKFSSGFDARTLIEVKLARNTRFWNGLSAQLPAYMRAEEITHGHFLVVCYTKDELQKRKKAIGAVLDRVRKKTKYDIAATFIDATPGKPSASKL